MKNNTEISQKCKKTAKKQHFLSKFKGFQVISPKTTFIEKGAKIGKGCVIYPNVFIDKNCIIGANTIIYSSCMLEGVTTGKNCKIGPFAHTRTPTYLGNNVRLGNFCETKNCKIGDNTKIAHLTYIGDAEIGSGCNFGCGVVFANYNGKTKFKTFVGNNCFIGCNVNLIAPLKIENNCFIGAGTTLSKDLETNTFALTRADLTTKTNKLR